MLSLLKKFIGSSNDRLLKQLERDVKRINALEPAMQALSNDQLQALSAEFKARVQAGESLDAMLPEAFALVRESSQRVFGMRHFDVQLIGAIVCTPGKLLKCEPARAKP